MLTTLTSADRMQKKKRRTTMRDEAIDNKGRERN
jgi:hypothetical protein